MDLDLLDTCLGVKQLTILCWNTDNTYQCLILVLMGDPNSEQTPTAIWMKTFWQSNLLHLIIVPQKKENLSKRKSNIAHNSCRL